MENRYYTGFAIAFIQSGGVQKLGGAVFCKAIRRISKTGRSGFLQSNPEEFKNWAERFSAKQSGGVQKLGGAVFCKAGTGEKLTINIVSNQWRIGISHSAFFPDD